MTWDIVSWWVIIGIVVGLVDVTFNLGRLFTPISRELWRRVIRVMLFSLAFWPVDVLSWMFDRRDSVNIWVRSKIGRL